MAEPCFKDNFQFFILFSEGEIVLTVTGENYIQNNMQRPKLEELETLLPSAAAGSHPTPVND